MIYQWSMQNSVTSQIHNVTARPHEQPILFAQPQIFKALKQLHVPKRLELEMIITSDRRRVKNHSLDLSSPMINEGLRPILL